MDSKFSAAIIHGSGGDPNRNWFPWLKSELESRSISTLVPQFPTPEGQSVTSWMATFASEVGVVHDALLLFGHSTGVALILNLLNQAQSPARATFLVGGFVGKIGSDIYDPMNESFFSHPLDWDRIIGNAGRLFIYAGDNDPYVSLSKSIELARLLRSELIVIPGGGHLNQDSGYKKFPRLLADLDSFLR